MKVAKLVTISVTTRVIVDSDSTEEQIMEKALPQLKRNLAVDGAFDHYESIVDDIECPVGTSPDDVYYQPTFQHPNRLPEDLFDHEVFKSKELCQKSFPDFFICEYSGDDIEKHEFVDELFEGQTTK